MKKVSKKILRKQNKLLKNYYKEEDEKKVQEYLKSYPENNTDHDKVIEEDKQKIQVSFTRKFLYKKSNKNNSIIYCFFSNFVTKKRK